jgi:hypothetical protein
MQPLTTQIVISRFKKVWGERFDYSQVSWQGSTKSVLVTCKKHTHTFSIRPGLHWKGAAGCKYCQRESYMLDTDIVLQRFEKAWDSTYDYSKFEYVHQTHKSIIICKEHGEFLQEPVNHWAGHGCPRCALKVKHGLGIYHSKNDKMCNLTGVIYILEIKTIDEHFFKVGISKHSGKKRISDSGKKLSGKAQVIFESDRISLALAHKLEQEILNHHTKYIPKFKYNGYKESLLNNPIDMLQEMLRE